MLLYGGIYGNPNNKNSKNGNLRLLYECAPMSYLIEQAGGKATDGHQRILEIKPEQVLLFFLLSFFVDNASRLGLQMNLAVHELVETQLVINSFD